MFNTQISHIVTGLKTLYGNPATPLLTPKSIGTPLVYCVSDAASSTAFKNLLQAGGTPPTKFFVFVGEVTVNMYSNGGGAGSVNLSGINPGEITFGETDQLDVNPVQILIKSYNVPVIATDITNTLTNKYALTFFGYIFQYK